MATAEAQARWRQRKRAEARLATLDTRELSITFLTGALTWARGQTGITARRLALQAADALDRAQDRPEDDASARLRAFALREGITGAVEVADDHARATAVAMLDEAMGALEAGTADLADVRAGIAAVRSLGRQRPRVNDLAVANWITRAQLGAPPPADLVAEDVDDEWQEETE